MGLKTVCDKKHASKHQIKDDQTQILLPPRRNLTCNIPCCYTFGQGAIHVLQYAEAAYGYG